ncbi:MAG: TIGR00266 family protein [Ichthyobacteriaceae bacterium]|nr:TIGR00266 family protein [Ichthyobacteriaceae bacterium]
MNSHEIDYKIYGDDMQFVEIELDPQETVVAESGAMMMMDEAIEMETIFGDGSEKNNSIMGKLFSAGKRVLTGESLFMTAFTNTKEGKKHVSFASPFPGSIIPVDLSEYNGKVVCQKDSFVCAAKGVEIGIEFTKKLGAAFFGGEGFVLQKLEGDGLAFIHAGGTLYKKDLQPGEVLKVDTGSLVAFTNSVDYDIERVGGIKNSLFGGEGFFFVRLEGPGTIWVQSLPISRMAGRLFSLVPGNGGKRRGEGGILGGLGDLIDGDND